MSIYIRHLAYPLQLTTIIPYTIVCLILLLNCFLCFTQSLRPVSQSMGTEIILTKNEQWPEVPVACVCKIVSLRNFWICSMHKLLHMVGYVQVSQDEQPLPQHFVHSMICLVYSWFTLSLFIVVECAKRSLPPISHYNQEIFIAARPVVPSNHTERTSLFWCASQGSSIRHHTIYGVRDAQTYITRNHARIVTCI